MSSHAAIAVCFFATACGAGPQPKPSAADPKGSEEADSPKLTAGATVCINEVAGIRYVVEDMLRARSLELADDCMGADLRVQEKGKEGAWVFRYQVPGDKDWRACESQQKERSAFLEDCGDELVGALGIEAVD
jgi:hypothetical protein